MFLDEGVDTGPILLSRETEIGAAETAGDLHDRLAVMGADLLLETIAGLKAGTVSPTPQPEEGASRGRLLTKADGRVDWTRPAEELSALIRGMDPWPGAYAAFRNKTLKLFGARAGAGRGRPGQVLALHEGWLHVAAGAGSVGVSELQLAGKKRQGAEDFWRGQRLDSTVFFE
jgi:methionyl-tRNA formyltransferase